MPRCLLTFLASLFGYCILTFLLLAWVTDWRTEVQKQGWTYWRTDGLTEWLIYWLINYLILQVHWTTSYVERYLGTDDLPKSEVISFLQRHADAAFLRKWKLSGVPKSIRKNRNCSQLVAAYKVLYDTLTGTWKSVPGPHKRSMNFPVFRSVSLTIISWARVGYCLFHIQQARME